MCFATQVRDSSLKAWIDIIYAAFHKSPLLLRNILPTVILTHSLIRCTALEQGCCYLRVGVRRLSSIEVDTLRSKMPTNLPLTEVILAMLLSRCRARIVTSQRPIQDRIKTPSSFVKDRRVERSCSLIWRLTEWKAERTRGPGYRIRLEAEFDQAASGAIGATSRQEARCHRPMAFRIAHRLVQVSRHHRRHHTDHVRRVRHYADLRSSRLRIIGDSVRDMEHVR